MKQSEGSGVITGAEMKLKLRRKTVYAQGQQSDLICIRPESYILCTKG